MAIYVDFMQIEFKGYKWCHLLPAIRIMMSQYKCVKPLLSMALFLPIERRLSNVQKS